MRNTLWFFIVFSAAMANVYTQLVMQGKPSQHLAFQNAQLYVYGIAFNGLNWINSARTEPAFGDIGVRQVAAMLTRAVSELVDVLVERLEDLTFNLVPVRPVWAPYAPLNRRTWQPIRRMKRA